MAKKKQDKDLYVDETRIWLQQQQNRLHSCEIAIDYYIADIRNARAAIALERKQMRLIKQRKQLTEKELSGYKKKLDRDNV